MRFSPSRVETTKRTLSLDRVLNLNLDLVIDNSAAVLTGTWTSGNASPGFFGSNYIYATTEAGGTRSVKWVPKITRNGTYSLYVNISNGNNQRDSAAKYTIVHAEGTSYVQTDQRIRGGAWTYLGTYQFERFKSQYIEINNNKATAVNISADAIRLVFEEFNDYNHSLELEAQVISDGMIKLNIADTSPLHDNRPYWLERIGASETATSGFVLPSGTETIYDAHALVSAAETYTYRIRKLGYKTPADSVAVNKPAHVAKSSDILVSQAGYRVSTQKKALIKSSSAATTFSLIDTVSGNEVVSNRTLAPFTDPISGNLLVADFSEVTSTGHYRIVTNNGLHSAVFQIAQNIYDEANRIMMKNLKLNRWPAEKTAPREDTGESMAIGGGWEDAWDYKHWTSYNDTIQPFVLVEMIRNGLDTPEVREELRWGLDYLLKIQERNPNGSGVMKFGQVIAAYSEVDSMDSTPFIVRMENVDNTTDLGGYNKRCEHVIAHYLYSLALAKGSTIFKADASYSQQLKTQAIDAYNYMAKYDELSHVKYAESFTTKDYFRAYPVLNYCYKIMAAEELFKITGEAKYMTDYKTYIAKLVQCQKKDFKWNNRGLTGYFMKEENSTIPMRNRIHAAIPLYVLAKATRDYSATESEWLKWYSCMKIFIECFVKKFYQVSAYEIMPYGFGVGTRKMHTSDTSTYRFFQGAESEAGGYSDGNAKFIALYAAALYQASVTTADAQLEEIGNRQLEWVFGKNHFGIPNITGFGELKIDSSKFYSHGYPADSYEAIGAVINGIDGANTNDAPQWGSNWQTGETWGVNRAWLQLALSSLKTLDDTRDDIETVDYEVETLTTSSTNPTAGSLFTITATIKNNTSHVKQLPITVYAENATISPPPSSVSVNANSVVTLTLNLVAGAADKPYVFLIVPNRTRKQVKSIVGLVN